MNFEELICFIQSRRSIRKWAPKEVPDELLVKAIEVATWAPNGGNYQPWRFYVIKNKSVIKKMGELVEEVSEQMLAWPEAVDSIDIIKKWLKSASFFKNAPACIAITVLQYESLTDKLVRKRSNYDPVAKEILKARLVASSRLQTAAASTAYLLLALHQLGLGAVWMAGPVQAKTQIENLLDIPSDQDFVALVPVGYPAKIPDNPGRKPVSEVVKFIG
jgi:nitroreductase